MSRIKEVRRYLRRTMEVSIFFRNLLVFFGSSLLLVGLIFLNTRNWPISLAVPAAYLVPYLIFFLIRYARIMAKAERYCFYQVKLDAPHHSWWVKHRSYFTVALDEGNGTHTVVDTHAVFSDHGFFWPAMESCLNQTVTVCYNPETKMVIVAG